MKKGNKRLLVVIALLLLVVISYSTYAIYKSSFSGNATATAAKWAIDIKKANGTSIVSNTQNLTFDLSSCTNNYTQHVADGKIAPGSTCAQTITIDADGSEVDVDYTVSVGTITGTNLPSGITADVTGGTSGSKNGIITYSATSGEMEATAEIKISWAAVDSDTTINPDDTAFGVAEGVVTVPVTVVAKQAHTYTSQG